MSSPPSSQWQRHTDRTSGRYYYYNPATGETTWAVPSTTATASTRPPQSDREAATPQSRSNTIPSSTGPRNPVSNPHAQPLVRPASAYTEGSAYTTTTPRDDDSEQQNLSSQFQQRLRIGTQTQAQAESSTPAPSERGMPPISRVREAGGAPPSQKTLPTNIPTTSAAGSGQSSQPGRKQAMVSSGKPNDPPGATGLSPDYKVREKPNKFFRLGKVFTTLYSESTVRPADGRSEITKGHLGVNVYQEIVWFVVIRESQGSCAALRILTYGGRGCGKSGVLKSDHARIHTSPEPPVPSDAERMLRRGEEHMQVAAFRVQPHIKGEKLDPMSRINLGKVYTIEHNVKVRGFGEVESSSFQALYQLHKIIWNRDPPPTLALPTTREHPEENTAYAYSTGGTAASLGQRSLPAQTQYGTSGQGYSNSPVPSSAAPQSSSYGTSGGYMPRDNLSGKSPMTEAQARQHQQQLQLNAQQQQQYLQMLQVQQQQQQQQQQPPATGGSTQYPAQYGQATSSTLHQKSPTYQYAQPQSYGQQQPQNFQRQQYPQQSRYDQTQRYGQSSNQQTADDDESSEEDD